MNKLSQHGLHAPNVPFDQYSRTVGGLNPSSDALWYRIGLARGKWLKLLQTDHTPNDARAAVDAGMNVLVRVKGEGTVYHQDVLRAIHEYRGLARILEIGNEPSLADRDLWTHAWYLSKILDECKDAAHAAKMRLCSPGWLVFDAQGRPVPPPTGNTSLDQRLYSLYNSFDIIGIHAYDPHNLLSPAIVNHIQRWMGAFPSKEYAITEYGIAAKSTPNAIKAQRYADFVRSLPSSVVGAFAFILGGTPEFASFNSSGYDPNGENSYWLEDENWERLGNLLSV